MRILPLLLIAILSSFSTPASAVIIGDVWEGSSLSKNDKWQQVTGGKDGDYKGKPDDRRVYLVKFTGRTTQSHTVYVVSRATGRIVSIAMVGEFTTVQHAVAMASSICEGEVEMPVKAGPKGFRCTNKPGAKYGDKPFTITIEPPMIGDKFTLVVECMSFMHATP